MMRAWKALPVLALVLALGMSTAQAETDRGWGTDYGPGGTSYFSSAPIYTLPIRILDALAPQLIEKKHKRLWRDFRNTALERWAASGVTFTVEPYTGVVPDPRQAELIPANAIILIKADDDIGGWWPSSAGGAALVSTVYIWRHPAFAEYIIAHEIGHALGFGHGGEGVMWHGNAPNAEDLTLLRNFYLGAAA